VQVHIRPVNQARAQAPGLAVGEATIVVMFIVASLSVGSVV